MDSDAAYRAAPGLNWSKLKPFSISPRHAKWLIDNERPDTKSLAWGRLVHCLLLEPKEINARYDIFDGRRGTKAYKEWQADRPGVEAIKPSEWDDAIAARDNVLAHAHAGYLLGQNVETEVPLAWTCPETGIDCKAKLDAIQPETRTLIDVKTSRSIDARTFGRTAATLGYHGQLAHYAEACTHALGWRPERVVIIAVESSAPFDVAVFDLDDGARWAGEVMRAELLELYQKCKKENAYPGRYPHSINLQLPAWAYPDSEDLSDLDLEF